MSQEIKINIYSDTANVINNLKNSANVPTLLNYQYEKDNISSSTKKTDFSAHRTISYSSACTSTTRATSGNKSARVFATSLTELPVGMTRDKKRSRSEPGSLSSAIVMASPTTTTKTPSILIKPPRSTTASRIASLDKLDLSGIVKSETTSSQTSYNNVQMTSVASAIISPITSMISVPSLKKSNWENKSTENESDYVVDPVQGTAYHKGQFLGKGGFARVYLMTDITNGKKYACKIIPKNRMQKIHIQKIAREILIHKDLNHINVVQMHHYFENSFNVYMLLEACPRKSLMHVLKYRGKVTEPEARYYMKQMVTGVAYIHSKKVVHRDLKPGNMFLSDGMIVKIGDFGLATRADGQRRKVTICGTPNYIAPEVLYKQAYSYEADVWALGCILYVLLAGQPPFDTATLKETYARICNNRYKKLDDSIISKSGGDLIRWLLQPIPELRPSLERVKEHPYLTMEYVPKKLTHSCCYRVPDLQGSVDQMKNSLTLAPPPSFPSASTLSSGSCTSSMSQPGTHLHRLAEENPEALSKHLKITIHNAVISRMGIPAVKNINTSEKITKKISNVDHWLVRKFPKLTRLRQRLGNFLYSDREKPSESILMHHALESCLAEIRYTRAKNNPRPIKGVIPLFVTKWIDYSNKYGLCFQLSDRSVGVLFNDSTKMSYTRDRRRIEYTTPDDEVSRFARERDVPSIMHEKLELLRHFTEYMDDHLTNGGEIGDNGTTTKISKKPGNVPRMRRWLRTDKAIVMELTVPLLQVNFFVDHTKIIVSESSRPRDYLVTYIDANRYATSYWLKELRDEGCTMELYERLNYVCKASREFAHLQHHAGFSKISVNRETSFKS